MSEKIKVGNAKVEKANYDYFSFMYEKMDKKYVVADLVSKCEDYDKLYKNYEMKDLQIEEYQKALDETTSKKIDLENIIKEVREYIEQDIAYCKAITEPITKQQYILQILDKVD